MHKILNVPVSIWIAQIIYVIVMLAVLVVIVSINHSNEKFNVRTFAIWYVVGMIVINIIWRLIAAKLISQ